MTKSDFMSALKAGSGPDISPNERLRLDLVWRLTNCTITSGEVETGGLLNFAEFLILSMLLKKENAEYEIAFRFFDFDKDGIISRAEFLQAFEVLVGHDDAGLHPNLQKDLLNAVGTPDFENGMTYEEFSEWLQAGHLPHLTEFWRGVTSSLNHQMHEQWLGMAVDTSDDMHGLSKSTTNVKSQHPLKYLLAGGMAGAVSRSVCAPMIRLKMMMQTDGRRPPLIKGIRQGFQVLLERGGVRGLFRGNGTNVLRIAPTSACQFCFFEKYKEGIFQIMGVDENDLESQQGKAIMARLIAGGLAGSTSAFLMYPLDLIRARLTVQQTPQYKSIAHAYTTIVKEEGFAALYKGLTPTMMGVFPYIGLDFAIYETLKPHAPRREGSEEITTTGLLTCGGVAGAVSQTIAFPLELIRRRLQVQGFQGLDYGYGGLGVLGAMRHTVRKEGAKGLYRGLLLNYIKAVPSIGISFLVYERTKTMLFKQ